MSLLSYYQLIALQEQGIIKNSLPEHVNQTSIDITLAEEILVEMLPSAENCILSWKTRQQPSMKKIKLPYVLAPGEFILAASEQIFNLPDWLSAEYKLKSSMARCGINHLNAGWCDPGWNGSALTLELVNTLQRHRILLEAGERIGQIVFMTCERVPAHASYRERGRYNNDKAVQGLRP